MYEYLNNNVSRVQETTTYTDLYLPGLSTKHRLQLGVRNAYVTRGLNHIPPCERTILGPLDFSKTFVTVNLTTLLEDIEQSSLPS